MYRSRPRAGELQSDVDVMRVERGIVLAADTDQLTGLVSELASFGARGNRRDMRDDHNHDELCGGAASLKGTVDRFTVFELSL